MAEEVRLKNSARQYRDRNRARVDGRLQNVLRCRVIKPGIVLNETLAALGPYATLLFERLWMLADREGRIEYRPERIRVEVFPYWPEINVEDLVEKLMKSGFVQKYRERKFSSTTFIVVLNFRKHQSIHPNEAKSVLPPPPEINDLDGGDVITLQDTSRNGALLLPLPLPSDIEDSGVGRGSVREEEENTPPPPSSPTPSTRKTRAPKRREPGRATGPGTPAAGERPPTTRQQAVDFWPHDPKDVEWVRDLLVAVGREAHIGPPDDQILRRILDAGRGLSAGEIYRLLRHKWQRGRFRSMQSWGLLPLVVGSAVKAA